MRPPARRIARYLEERTSRDVSRKELGKGTKGKDGKEEEHTGITDDEADDEGEPDYDVAGRMTLKASSEAFMEVMAEAQQELAKEDALKAKPPAKKP
ncbi:hypothetical protein GPECTOR_10g754 [Gonium pectorale]|uniref:Uncharacterized protein n=1 Tax=Gonium pectorale TaxID=33097 RepID=A0A150GQM3_GONPE|nr:hypothetical protein GPECTOR_10g754 [Gonium pectorale]|eukprot:KXZ52125.1 hypothetical protein GPECTOR_10g754 [Gonium pectorale]